MEDSLIALASLHKDDDEESGMMTTSRGVVGKERTVRLLWFENPKLPRYESMEITMYVAPLLTLLYRHEHGAGPEYRGDRKRDGDGICYQRK